jgi:hypothetical protein
VFAQTVFFSHQTGIEMKEEEGREGYLRALTLASNLTRLENVVNVCYREQNKNIDIFNKRV